MKSITSGFTLLELLIGMSLLGLLIALLFSGFRLGANSWNAAEKRIEQSTDIQSARHFLRQSLEQAYPLRRKGVAPQKIAFAGSPDEIHFISALPAQLATGGMREMRLSVTEGRHQAAIHLQHLPADYGAEQFPVFDGIRAEPLLTKARKISFAFFGIQPGAKDMTWSDRWPEGDKLPELISIHIQLDEGLEWPDLIVRPVINEQESCKFDSFYRRCARI